IGPIVYAFFEQHLKAEKGLSQASVSSYRDALRLFLSFVASERGRAITLGADNQGERAASIKVRTGRW
ncbi:MAG: site-specific integrase, partial [Pseudorhodoplanes sp.]|nr:site-specific integrase [Pseudorhodoplanes sp.]